MILTINRIKALELFLSRIIGGLYDATSWLHDKKESTIRNLAYKVVERASDKVNEADERILDLEDDRAEATTDYRDAVRALKARFHAMELELTGQYASELSDIDSKLADASLRVLTLEDRYEEVVAGVRDELGVEVDG